MHSTCRVFTAEPGRRSNVGRHTQGGAAWTCTRVCSSWWQWRGGGAAAGTLWKSMGLVYAAGEAVFLEQVHAGAAFETREAAMAGGIEAVRAIARTLAPGDCRANRAARFW